MSTPTTPPAGQTGWLRRAVLGLVTLLETWLGMNCRAFIRLASEALDRPLGPVERLRQAMHRFMCRVCRLQEQRMAQLHALAHELGSRAVDDGRSALSPDARERLRSAVSEAAQRRDTPGSSSRGPG